MTNEKEAINSKARCFKHFYVIFHFKRKLHRRTTELKKAVKKSLKQSPMMKMMIKMRRVMIRMTTILDRFTMIMIVTIPMMMMMSTIVIDIRTRSIFMVGNVRIAMS